MTEAKPTYNGWISSMENDIAAWSFSFCQLKKETAKKLK